MDIIGRIVTQPPLLVIYMVSAVLLPAVSLHFYQVFPRPKPWLEAQARPNLVLDLRAIVGVLWTLCLAATFGRGREHGGMPALEVETALLMLARVIYGYFGVAAILYLASVFCLAHSYRRAQNEVEGNQVRWIFVGSVLAIIPLGYSLYSAVWLRQDLTGGPALWPMFTASVCFTLAFTVSITRYRLLQLDQLLTSGVAGLFGDALAALVYYSLVFGGTLIMGTQGESGPSLEQAFWVSGSALVLTAGLDLARSRLRGRP